jgi:hypothetical protein
MRLVAVRIPRPIYAWIGPVLLAAVTIAFIIVLVDPFSALPEPVVDDIALGWNTSLSRLGILPVFPPVEDFHVGDLLVMVTEGDEEAPLLRKAVRLAHIDLRDAVLAERTGQPVFPDTVMPEAARNIRIQPSAEVAKAEPADPISLTLTAFPGISIRHGRHTKGSFGARLFGFSASREALDSEEIRIPVAETYGVNAASAIARLAAWCEEPDTQVNCTDDFARRVMAFTVSDQVLATRNGQYVFRLQLCLVTRVFLMREIEYRNLRQGSADASASAEAPSTSSSAGSVSGGGDISRERKTDVTLRQVFQRPLTFGFRGVNVALAPAIPSEEHSP